MDISKNDLDNAVAQQILSAEQAQALWTLWETQTKQRPRFDFVHVAYYFGALIVISAMTWFMTEAWEVFGGAGIFAIAIAYAVGFGLVGINLWYKDNLRVPGGLLFTLMVCMTPLAVYGLEDWLDLWSQGEPGSYHDFYVWIKSVWFAMEITTLTVASITLFFIRFPFLTAPIAFILWFISMDLTPLLFGDDFDWETRRWVSLHFGLIMLLIAYFIDRRTKEDFAFWIYLFGLIAFWGSLSLMDSGTELGKFLYFLINLGLILVSVLLQRRTFIVFGALGAFIYVGHLAFQVFQDSLLFPFALTFIGILIIYIGVLFQRYHARFERHLLESLPPAFKALLPSSR